MKFEDMQGQEIDNNVKELPEKIARIECPQGPITLDNEDKHILFTNFLQIALAIRRYGISPGNSVLGIWENSFSEKFREIFEETIKKDSLFFDGFKNIGDIPEEKWEVIEKKLYGESPELEEVAA